MSDISTKQSESGHKTPLLNAIRDRLTEELKREFFLQQLFENKHFRNDFSPGQVVELPYAEIYFGLFHVECLEESCWLYNLKWSLPEKLLIHEIGNQQSIQQDTGEVFIGFISSIKYTTESLPESDEQLVRILEFELTKPIPIVKG